ncbi:MAG: hypothetical protein KTR27_08870 [Leptolyngbyaceae cyanobacterium MAG.088]|nr:hypothetical protein [Leptolyngbyaceae cyanobacterium MAG.088]
MGSTKINPLPIARWAMATQKLKRFVTLATISAIHNLPKEESPATMQYDESL